MRKVIAFLLFVSTSILGVAQGITLKQVGKPNQYMNIQFLDRDNNGHLYTISFANGLNKTNLATGELTKVNDVNFKNTRFFFYYRFKLYSIDKDGSMMEIDPSSGTWTTKSPINTWSFIDMPIVVGSFFYAIENGSFYRYTSLDPNKRTQVGGSDFYNANTLIRTDTTLYSFIREGSFYQINLRDGEWKRIGKGKSKAWKAASALAVVNNKLYTIETGGALYETSLPDGERKLLDANQLEKGRLLIADSGKLYTITLEGNLFEVVINP